MNELIIDEDIKDKIYIIKDMQVMIDRDLAKLYGVETKVFNQAVKRNIERFPSDFMFQHVFTEQGVSMLSAILKSDIAINISVKIIRAFVNMRKVISHNNLIYKKLDKLERIS